MKRFIYRGIAISSVAFIIGCCWTLAAWARPELPHPRRW